MLEVGTETLSLESGPGGDLVGAAGLRGPLWEAVGVESKVGLEAFNGWGIDVEEDLLGVSVLSARNGRFDSGNSEGIIR